MGDIIPDVSDVFAGGLDPTAADYPLAADLSGGFAGGGGFDPLGFADSGMSGGGFFGPGDLSAEGTGMPAGFNPQPGDLGGQNLQNLQTQVSPGPSTTNIPETESAPAAPAPNPLSALIPPQGPGGLGSAPGSTPPSSPLQFPGGGVTPFNAQTVGSNVVPGTATPAIQGTTLEGGNYGPVPASAAARSAPTPLPTTSVSAPVDTGSSAPAAQTAEASNAVAAGNAAGSGAPAAGAAPGGGSSPIGQALSGMGIGGPLQKLLGDFFQLLSGHGNPMGALSDIMQLMRMVMNAQQGGGMFRQAGGGQPGMGGGAGGGVMPGGMFTDQNGRQWRNLGRGLVQDARTGAVYNMRTRQMVRGPTQGAGAATNPVTGDPRGSSSAAAANNNGKSSPAPPPASVLPGAPNDIYQAGQGA